jgi:hypothetical protein
VVSGTSPTTLQAKVWRDGQAEPAAWQVSGSDNSAALQTAGGAGLMAYLSGSTTNAPVGVTFDTFRVYDSTTTLNAAQAMALAKVARTAPKVHPSRVPTAATRVAPDLKARLP